MKISFKIFSLALLFLVGSFCWGEEARAADYYVRPVSGDYGTENGFNYENAWNGFDNIVWSNINPGDTLNVCGTHYEKLTIENSGNEGSLITITGDCSGDAGTIDGSEDIKNGTWTEGESNIWCQESTYVNTLTINDLFATYDYDMTPDSEGEWYTTWPSVCIYSTMDPSLNSNFNTIRANKSSNEFGIKIFEQDYVKVEKMTIQRIGSRENLYNDTDGGVLINDSDYCEIRNNIIKKSALGIVIAGNSDHAIVSSNVIRNQFKRDSANPEGRYSRGIMSVGNDVTISDNDIDAKNIFYDGTVLYCGMGIDLQQQNYPDYYSKNAIIKNNEVQNLSHFAIRIQQFVTGMGIQPINAKMFGNYVHGSTQGTGTGEEDGLALGSNAGDNDNHFYGVEIYNNMADGFSNTGVIVANFWDQVDIYNNIIKDSGGEIVNEPGAGIYVSGGLTDKTVNAFNNVIYDSFEEGIAFWAGSSDCSVQNNIILGVSNNQNGHGLAVYSAAVGKSGSNNLFYDIQNDDEAFNFTRINGFSDLAPLFNNFTSSFSIDTDFTLQSTSPAIDTGVIVEGLATDYANNQIYGIPDIGAYEYQPPYTAGIDEIDTDSDVRIYGDGKFRNTKTPGGITANLSIDPVSNDTSQWLDIDILTWNNSGSYEKQWTEDSSNIADDVLHTVGDLEANKYYTVKVDDNLGQDITGGNCTDGVCLSNDQGKIAFTYTGNYSTHTFKVEEGDNTSPIVSKGDLPEFHTDTTQVTLSLTTNEDSICKYSIEDITYDNMTIFTITGGTNHSTEINNLSLGDYTYYATCRDSVGNDTSHNLTFEIAASEGNAEISDVESNDKDNEILEENKKLYFEDNKPKFKGEDSIIANGKVKIYKDGKKYATVQVDESGKWDKTVSFGHNRTYELKFKFYDEFDTLQDTKEYTIKVDIENPIFKDQVRKITKDQIISFSAEDEDSKVDYYKVKVLDNQGHILRSWKKQKKTSYSIPEKVKDQAKTIIVRAYDKAGNKTEQTFEVGITQSLSSEESGQVEVQGVQATNKKETQTEDRVTNPLQQEKQELSSDKSEENTQAEIKQENPEQKPEIVPAETKDSYWYNPFSWF